MSDLASEVATGAKSGDDSRVPLRGNPAYLSNVARDVLAEVQQAHRDGRLGYLVGAGLSVPIGLP